MMSIQEEKPLTADNEDMGNSDNYDHKINMIRAILNDIKKRKVTHYTQYGRFKTISNYSKGLINGLNAISVCSMILTYTPMIPGVMIVALSTTTVSSLASAISNAIDVDGRYHSHHTSYLQYTDLSRDISARIFRNGLSSKDLDNMLSELNDRMGLIEDFSLPI
jgi:hypothetical protein